LKERIKHNGGDFLSTSVNKENEVFVLLLWTKKEQVSDTDYFQKNGYNLSVTMTE